MGEAVREASRVLHLMLWREKVDSESHILWLLGLGKTPFPLRASVSLNILLLHFLSSRCCCSITKSCPTLCDPMDCGTPGFPVLYCLLEFAQGHVHWISDAIQTSHPLSPSSPSAFNLSQHQGFFQWASCLYPILLPSLYLSTSVVIWVMFFFK